MSVRFRATIAQRSHERFICSFYSILYDTTINVSFRLVSGLNHHRSFEEFSLLLLPEIDFSTIS